MFLYIYIYLHELSAYFNSLVVNVQNDFGAESVELGFCIQSLLSYQKQ